MPTDEFPSLVVQRNGFRYLPTQTLPWLTGTQVRPLHTQIYLARHDRSQGIVENEFGQTACNAMGYRSVLASEGVYSCNWYWEAGWSGESIRLGVALMGTELNGPIGLDSRGWTLCSTGGLFHNGKRTKSGVTFNDDDIIGCCLRLGRVNAEEQVRVLTNPPDRKLISYFKLYLEEKLPKLSIEDRPHTPSASLEFYKNGELMDVAFTNLSKGIYYPAFSLFRNTSLEVNFGPHFLHTPPNGSRPFCEVLTRNLAASNLADIKNLIFNK